MPFNKSPAPPLVAAIMVTLDRPRAVRWTHRARALNSSLARPVEFEDLGDRKRGLYALCAIIWASLEARDHPWTAPEDLAEYFDTAAKQVGGFKVVRQLIDDAYPPAEDKKKPRS